ncbi:ArsR/SmtB family transcription factor [Bradyrhizobium sp. RDT10]
MKPAPTRQRLEAASMMFRALADLSRLQTLIALAQHERSVTQLAEMEGEKIATVSARLKVLLTARLVTRRRDGQRIYYMIADDHVLGLIRNAIDHASH